MKATECPNGATVVPFDPHRFETSAEHYVRGRLDYPAELKQEGIIKYDRSRFVLGPPPPLSEYQALENCRERLHALGLIGVTHDGIGFGNLSCRQDYSTHCSFSGPQFLITGSQTGHLSALTGKHYSRVLRFEIANVSVFSTGQVEASSETLTHAAIYAVNKRVTAIAHVHHAGLWRRLQEEGFPATAESLAYGTAEMALAVGNLARGKAEGLIAMKGHAEGSICFASSLDRIAKILTLIINDLRDL